MERYEERLLPTMLAFFVLDNDFYVALAKSGANTDLVLEQFEVRARALLAALTSSARDEVFNATLFYRQFALKAVPE
ncbi:MAG: hypothetical protein J6126_05435 [Clostridia bacterium]|nr:hypothetical protein [Clostridia bacterium]